MNEKSVAGLSPALGRYVAGGHREVAGWLLQPAVDAILELGRIQSRLGVRGGVCEIGIHHGRSFILLHLLTAAGEHSAAYDLFEQQSENVDRSGLGDKDLFLLNLKRHACDQGRIVVKSRNSLDLTADEITADARGPVRLFSVDGGHTAEITASDLRLAEATLTPGGLVILDDFFNEAWPAVSEGACRHLFSGSSNLLPVAIGGNKFIFTNDAGRAAEYRAALASLPGYACKSETVFGAPVVVVQPQSRTVMSRLANLRLWRAVRGSAAGRALRPLALRLLNR